MREMTFETADVFTTQRFGGNQLAVITDALGLSDQQMQLIASEFNYSETTFVLPPRNTANIAQVRIFTPTNEIPFAGHPNIGTAFILGRQENVFGKRVEPSMRFEEGAGLVKVDLLHQNQSVVGARFKAPRPLDVVALVDPEIVAECVSLNMTDIATNAHPPSVVSVGLPFVVAETGLDVLAKARPNSAAFAAADGAYPHADDRFSVFLYARLGHGVERLRARMFAPLSNIPEDPATGSASAALGAFLGSLDPREDLRLDITIEQGVEMGRPSLIQVAVLKQTGSVHEVSIAGYCVPIMRGTVVV
jgi:trans-2,3-dihydro-3-hydroxyanthranilate isomerase